MVLRYFPARVFLPRLCLRPVWVAGVPSEEEGVTEEERATEAGGIMVEGVVVDGRVADEGSVMEQQVIVEDEGVV